MKSPEDHVDPDEELRKRGKVTGKSRPQYERLAAGVPGLLRDQKKLKRVSELERFAGKLHAACKGSSKKAKE